MKMTERNGRPGYTCNFRSDFWCGFCLMRVNERAQHLYTIIGHLLAPVVNISDKLGLMCLPAFPYLIIGRSLIIGCLIYDQILR